jgi:hypothetical protein
MYKYRGLDEGSIEEYVRIAGETADTITKELTRESVFDPNMIVSLTIVENMIRTKRLVVYGGTALNAVLPERSQFYDPEYDLPDWDFFSDDPIPVAMDIADRVVKKTGSEASVGTAAHQGTYKVFSDGQAIADITYVPTKVLNMLRETAVVKNKIHYTGPEYLRMSAYLELSRPLGQPDRWDKVMRRISLLNREYPVLIPKKDGRYMDKVRTEKNDLLSLLMRVQDTKTARVNGNGSVFAFIGPEVLSVVKSILKKHNSAIASGSIRLDNFAGGIMIMSPNPEQTVELIEQKGDGKYNIVKREGSAEFLGEQYVIYSGDKSIKGYELCTIIGVHDACQSIYTLKVKHNTKVKSIRIGSVESMLYMYNSLMFASDKGSLQDHDLLKMIDSLIKIHIRILKKQKKSLLPFPSECIGKQETIKDMRDAKKKDVRYILRNKGITHADYMRRNIKYDGGDSYMRGIIERSFERERKELKDLEKKNSKK